jgi:hypothetical protein
VVTALDGFNWLAPSEVSHISRRGRERQRVGPPVLVVHGSGGGCDQGEFLAQAVLGVYNPRLFVYMWAMLPPS